VTGRESNVFAELEAAIELLKRNFLSLKEEDIDDVKLARRALTAMMSALGDPFTNYIPPAQLQSYQSRKVETVVGIGLQVEYDCHGSARVVSALTGSPADTNEIQLGHELTIVDKVNVRNGDAEKLKDLLNGPEGSVVNLTLVNSSDQEIKVAIKRRAVDVDYMQWKALENNLAMVRISWFSGTGYQWFIDKLKQKIDVGIKGLVLDLRSNSGGSIISTRNIFSSLCNQEVMYYGKKLGEDNIEDRVIGDYHFKIPLVVIINEDTFSAGEVLAGALQDYGRAVVVGSKSGGKGSMQQIFPLEGEIGGAMRITTATNCTPSGRIVQGRGIEPDIVIEQKYPELFVDDGPQNITEAGRSYLKMLRLECLQAKHGKQHVQEIWERGDQQLAKAIEALMKVV
jgi:carboxyl-terminal processing protease